MRNKLIVEEQEGDRGKLNIVFRANKASLPIRPMCDLSANSNDSMMSSALINSREKKGVYSVRPKLLV